jgi:hypothetical protein
MKHPITDMVAAIVAGVLFAALICLCLGWLEDVAWGEEGDEVATVVRAIRRLQPATDDERAARLAGIFVGAGHETRIDPLLLVAIAMRESSLSEDVEQLERLGSRGERGLMQCHGAALRVRPTGCGEDLQGAHCQVYTGAMWLAWVRDHCEGSMWVTVAAYGRRRCPSESEARADRNAAIAASYYSLAGGVDWR